jgi:hypothetical protein
MDSNITASQRTLIFTQLTQIKGRFILVSIFYLSLQALWEINLYLAAAEHNIKIYLSFRQLIKLKKMITRAKQIIEE